MTRARDFANVISGNFDLPATALDNVPLVFSKSTVASTGNVGIYLGGTNNFFDAGTLTGDTTVSFNNAPAKKKFTYSFIPGHNSSASSVNDTDTWQPDFTIEHTYRTKSYGAAYNADGTKVVLLDGIGDYLIEADLSIPYDDSSMARGIKKTYSLSTTSGTFVNSGAFGGSATGPRNVRFNADGTKLYILNYTTDQMFQYSLGTAYDLSTYTGVQYYSVSTYETAPTAWCFNSDGTKFFISGAGGDDINEFSMSTAYDITTAGYSRVLSSSSYLGASGLDSMMFGKDGLALFGLAAANTTGTIIKYDTSANAGSIEGGSVRTAQFMAGTTFGLYTSSTYGMNYINLDRIRVDQGYGGIIECGTSYWPTFSGTISGKLGHFSRGYRHFIDFETSNSGTSYGIIDHRKVYVG